MAFSYKWFGLSKYILVYFGLREKNCTGYINHDHSLDTSGCLVHVSGLLTNTLQLIRAPLSMSFLLEDKSYGFGNQINDEDLFVVFLVQHQNVLE